MKQDGKFNNVIVPQPLAINYHNQYMNGVDRSDQMLASHNVSQKCYRWWKILFFHLIDVAIVNYFNSIVHRTQMLKHYNTSNRYNVSGFREALVRQICGWPENGDPSVYVPASHCGCQF